MGLKLGLGSGSNPNLNPNVLDEHLARRQHKGAALPEGWDGGRVGTL